MQGLQLSTEGRGTATRYAFSPTVTADDSDPFAAWLELHDESVSLVCDAGVVRDERDFIGRPLALSTDERIYLCWSERTPDGRWPLVCVEIDDRSHIGEPTELTSGDRRPLDPTGCRTDDGLLLAWESTFEGDSEIRGLELLEGEWTDAKLLSAPSLDAAHDVAVAAGPDGHRYLLYTAFRDGWYEIEGRIQNAGSWSSPSRLTDQPAPAAYPTVAADPTGGAWVGWVHYQLPVTGPFPLEGRQSFRIDPYVTHERRQHQHAFFQQGRTIVVHHWNGEQIRAPVYRPEEWDHPYLNGSLRTSGRVLDAYFGTRPTLTIDGEGTPWLAWLGYDDSQTRPSIRAAHLTSWGWSAPLETDWQYGDAERIHAALDDEGRVVLASGIDERTDRSNPRTEFREEGEGCRVGTVELPLADASRPELRETGRWVHNRPDLRNPRLTDDLDAEIDGDSFSLVFCNFHRHTDLSQCKRSADGEIGLNLRHARDVMCEQATVLTDHAYNSGPLARYRTRWANSAYHWPGERVTIPSYEWTGTDVVTWNGEQYGHLNVHWFEGGEPPYGTPTWAESTYNTPESLWEGLSDSRALTIPHHTASAAHYVPPSVFGDLPSDLGPVAEVFQNARGSCETQGGPGATEYTDTGEQEQYLQAHLGRGVRLGFVGGGDHLGVGMTGLWVRSVSRDGIYDALRNRRCFATTGTTASIDFRIDGTFMGGTVETDSSSFPVSLRVRAPTAIQQVELVGDGDVIERRDVGERAFADRWSVERKSGVELAWHYPRVLLESGEVCWGSPIWMVDD